MKKLYLIVMVMIICGSSYAQLFKIAGQDVGFVYVGPKVGVNASQISNWTTFTGIENSYKYGFQIGAVGELGFTNRFSIDGELVFMSKGHKQTFDGGVNKYNVSYLGIPLLAKYSFKVLGLSKVYAKGGTFTNVRTGGTFTYELDTGEAFEETLTADGWRRVDWGLSIGAGAEYESDYGIWGVDIRYDQSFFDVHKSDPEKNRNRALAISIIYKYDLVDLMLRLRKKKLDQNE